MMSMPWKMFQRRPNVGRTTLARRLFLLFLVFSLGPLALSNLWGYLQTRRALVDAAFRTVRDLAAMEATRARDFFEDQLDLVPAIVAGNQHLFRSTRGTLQGDEEARRQLAWHLRAKAREHSDVVEFLVISPEGAVAASSVENRRSGANLSSHPCFRLGQRLPRLAGFERGADGAGSAEPVLLVGGPIRDVEGRYLGVFCARYRFDLQHELMRASAERTAGATVSFLDHEAHVVGSGSFGIGQHTHGNRRLAHVSGRPADRTRAWKAAYRDAQGQELIAAFVPLARFGGGVLVETPVPRALAALERIKWQAFGLSGLLALCLAWAVWRVARALSGDLASLSAAAERIASGALGEAVPSSGTAEMTQLADAFNRMSRSLEESHRLLEERVARRTEELRASRDFSDLLLDSLDEAIFVVGRDHAVVRASKTASRLCGDDLRDRTYHELWREDPPARCEVCQTFADGRPSRVDRRITTAAGPEIAHLQTYPLRSSDGALASVLVVVRIVTDERQRQAQMLHHEKMAAFGLFASGVAHEVGNPLASMKWQLAMARDEANPARREGAIRDALQGVDRIERLVRGLVDVARRRRDEVTSVSVNQAVSDATRLLGHHPQARGVEFECRFAPDVGSVRATEDQIVQILMNLGLNALDAMPEGGRLIFETGTMNGFVAVRVRDTGSGIPPAAHTRVFEPFFSTKPPGRGTGLGLYVSRNIVEALGGRLDLESTGPGGTVFALRLPSEPEAGARDPG